MHTSKGMLPDNLKHEALDLCIATANNDTYRQIGVYKNSGMFRVTSSMNTITKTGLCQKLWNMPLTIIV